MKRNHLSSVIHWRSLIKALFLASFISTAPLVMAEPGEEFCPPPVKFIHLIQLRSSQGHDISEAEELGKQARQKIQQGDRRGADSLLEEAINVLLATGEPVYQACPERDFGRRPPARGPVNDPSYSVRSPSPESGKDKSPFKISERLKKRLEEEKNGIQVPIPEGVSIYNASPFGVYGAYEIMFDELLGATYEELNAYMLDLGVTWAQEPPFSLHKLPTSISLYTRIGREGDTKPGTVNYQNYEKALRERINETKHRVKVYELCTEPDGTPPPTGWKGLETEYAEFLKFTHKILKEECPECILVFGGLTGVGTGLTESRGPAKFLDGVLKAGAAGAFDAFEFKQHMHNADEYTEIGNKYRVYADILNKYGVNIDDIPVYIEVATHDDHAQFAPGTPLEFLNSKLKNQTEEEQATSLVKTYIYSLGLGVDKIFWDMIVEHHRFGGRENNPFDLYGLVNNKHNSDGKDFKKLSYFSFKKMASILKDADFKSLKALSQNTGIYVYQINLASGRTAWIAWSESEKSEHVEISEIRSTRVSVVNSVPNAASGDEVKDFESAFKDTSVKVKNSKVRLKVGKVPTYIIEASE